MSSLQPTPTRSPELPGPRIPSNRLILGIGTLAFCTAAIFAVIIAIVFHGEHQPPSPAQGWIPSPVYIGVLCLWWAILFVLQQALARRLPGFWNLSLKTIFLQLGAACAIAIVHLQLLALAVNFTVQRWSDFQIVGSRIIHTISLQRFGLEVVLYILTWIAGVALHSQIARQKEALQTAELKQQLSSAHLRALQMQMEPHFLFNTLNAITTLVELGRQKEAVATLSHLNAILKSTLAHEAPEKVSIAQELAVLESYLAIEQIRFADRLSVTMSVDPGALNGMIPCFLLQPILENAIRHGVSHLEDNGLIQTHIERRGDLLHLKVRDNGPGPQSNSPGHGIGLKNIEGRLSHFYPGKYQFLSGRSESGGFEVSITIPYESQPA